MNAIRGLAGGALHLLVALVPDEQDLVAVAGEALDLVVDLGHQRARGIEGVQIQGPGLAVHLRGHAVGGEHQVGAVGHLVGLVDEDDALVLEGLDHELVVHDLLAHVQRGPVHGQGLFHGLDGAVDAGAVPARGGQQHLLLGGGCVG